MVIEKSCLIRRRQSRADAAKRREDQVSEEITGWAVNALFPLADVPNRYSEFPWRRIRKTRGLIWGTLFVVKVLAIWPFELTREILWSRDATKIERSQPREDLSRNVVKALNRGGGCRLVPWLPHCLKRVLQR
jgi:hypothetical protein